MRDASEPLFRASPLDPAWGAKLIDAAGSAQFGPLLLQAARSVGEADEVFAYRLREGGPPRTLVSCGGLSGIEQRIRLYSRSFHVHDPAAQGMAQELGGFTRHVRAEEIIRDDYRDVCFERPRFVDKICFGWRTESDLTVISFYRRAGPPCDHAALAAVASIGLSVLQHAATRPALVPDIERRLEKSFPQLTWRERQVCARTIGGWSAREIADALELTRATVLTYRQRAYHRLGFSKSADFLDSLMS